MIVEHRKTRRLLYEYIAGDLSHEEVARIESHTAACASCKKELEDLRSILGTLPSSPAPSNRQTEEYWQGFVDTVERRTVARNAREFKSLWQSIESLLVLRPRHAAVLGGSFALTAAAVFAWHIFSAPPAQQPFIVEEAGTTSEEFTPERVSQYFRKSKVLLVGLTNSKMPEDHAVDFSVERRASRELVREARYLRQQPLDRRSSHLIDNLEKILIELANLEETNDLPDVEIIRGGIQRENLLFKIRMAEARYDSTRFTQAKFTY